MANKPSYWLLRLFRKWHQKFYIKLLRTTLALLCIISLLIIIEQTLVAHGILVKKGGLIYNSYLDYGFNTSEYLLKLFVQLAIISFIFVYGVFSILNNSRKRIVKALWLFALLAFLTELNGFMMALRYVPKG